MNVDPFFLFSMYCCRSNIIHPILSKHNFSIGQFCFSIVLINQIIGYLMKCHMPFLKCAMEDKEQRGK